MEVYEAETVEVLGQDVLLDQVAGSDPNGGMESLERI